MRRVVPTSFPHPLLLDASSLGAAIRSARTNSGVTLTDAALVIGVSRQTLQDLEMGTGTVGIGLALKVSTEMGVSLFAIPTSERDIAVKTLTQQLDAAKGLAP